MMKKRIVTLIILLLSGIALISAQAPVRVAMLDVENLGGDPRHQYLEGMIQGVLLFDLTRSEWVDVVARSDLENILAEQRLRLSGLTGEEERALDVGRLLGADYLIRSGFAFLGEDVLFTVNLIDVETGLTKTVMERGHTENTIHLIAEQIVLHATGADVVFQDPGGERSIISMKDETPGSIALHTNLVDAEIYLDGDFIGYSTGDIRVPFLIENLKPGSHRVRIDLGRDFGIVKLPEFTFHDWEEEVQVLSGRRQVVRANASHFNNIIYNQMKRLYENFTLDPTVNLVKEEWWDASFVDRNRQEVVITLNVTARITEGICTLQADLHYDGEIHQFVINADSSRNGELREEVGKVEFRARVIPRYGGNYYIELQIWRTDIWQGMHRE